MNLDDLVPIPPKQQVNIGLSSAAEATMLGSFGRPGDLSPDCSDPTGDFKVRVRHGVDVGPFKVSGLDTAVESLLQIFAAVLVSRQDLYDAVKNAGMLCVRHRRSNPSRYSNHSWGCAIDLYFGGGVVDQGVHRAQRGIVDLVPFFNNGGWYWGGEFSGDSVDSMHFELAEETVLKMSTIESRLVLKRKRGEKR